MSRSRLVATGAALLLVGFIVGHATTSGRRTTVTVETTVEHSVVVRADHLGSARDPVDSGPLDLALVAARRRGEFLDTTIVGRHAWASSLLRRGRVSLSVSYDVTGDGKADRRDDVFLFHGRPTAWISSLGQGVMYAEVRRPNGKSLSVARDASVFFSASGQAGLLLTAPIGVAVTARWKGGLDRVPNRGWITVPPPNLAPPPTTAPLPAQAPTVAESTAPAKCSDKRGALARVQRDLAAIRRASRLPAANTLIGNHAINVATDRFLKDIALAPIGNLERNRLIDHAAAAVTATCQQCFQALEAERPIPSIRAGEAGC